MSASNKSTGGVGFTGLLLLLFITLKLCGVIDWSWWWVLSPFWIPLCLALLILLFCVCIAALCGQWPKRKRGNAP